VNERDANERNANERNANERNVSERDVNEWDNTKELNEENDELLVGIVWVGVGFWFENPHQAGSDFSGGERFGVDFTVGFWWVFTKPTLKKVLVLSIVLLE
jgi:hypothetical protein